MAAIDYTPPDTVKKFIKHFTPAELFFDWIIGPVGSGKTTGIFFKLVYMAKMQAKSPVDGVRRSRAVVVRNTMPQLRDTTLTSWNYWFKDGVAGTWYATSPTPTTFVLRFGDVECEVLFRALDTADDVQRVLSLEVTFAILDEFIQIDKKIVEALSARCGRYPPTLDGGATNWGMWGSSNPGNEDDWWHEYLGLGEAPLASNVTLWTQPSGFTPEAENVDNLPGKSKYYTSLAEGKSPHWVKQFIESEWGFSIAGTPVIKTFTPEIHVAKKALIPNPRLPLVIGFDPGMHCGLIYGQMDLDGRLLVYDETVLDDFGAQRLLTDKVKPLLKTRFPDFEVIFAPDPAADSRAQTDEKSVVDVLKKHKFTVKFPDMNNRLPLRVDAIEYFTTRLTSAGPALLVDPRCKRLIRAMMGGWRYAIDTKGKRNESPEKNAHSHPADAFGYLCRYFQHTEGRLARARSAPPPAAHVNTYVLGT